MRQPDFEPGVWFLAVSASRICGYCCTYAESHGDKECGLVDEFGVRPAWRRRGIGRALLLEAFGPMHARDKKAIELTVDSDSTSDALGVYEHVGMAPVRRNLGFVRELHPGKNLVAP